MPPEKDGTRPKVIHGAYGLMYLVAALAGLYGFFRPGGQVQALYGVGGNVAMLALITLGGVLGSYAYLAGRNRMELLAAPMLVCAVALLTPALFYAEIQAHQTAWYGWLVVGLGMSFYARWTDVRRWIEHERAERYRGQRRRSL